MAGSSRKNSVLRARIVAGLGQLAGLAEHWLTEAFGTNGAAARTWTTGVMLLWVTALLAAYLLLYY